MRLKEYEDFYAEILMRCPTKITIYVACALKEIQQSETAGDILCWLEGKQATVHYRTVYKAIKKLTIEGIIVDHHLSPPDIVPIVGIYGIFVDKDVYVGMSTNIQGRWETHKKEITLQAHPYIKNGNLDHVDFKVLYECRRDLLNKTEMLMAQKLKTEGFKILNESNFGLL